MALWLRRTALPHSLTELSGVDLGLRAAPVRVRREGPTEPRELYASLPDKSTGYGYLRDVQGQVLTAWHARRTERDLVVKVNTGGGKTIDGLVMLQSYLNDGKGPALYVAPR